MELVLCSISQHRKHSGNSAAARIAEDYAVRASRFQPTSSQILASEQALLAFTSRTSRRATAPLLLCDSRGDLVSSEELAQYLRGLRDSGAQRLFFAIGPADGWSPAAVARADRTISFGRMTLPHELARVVLAEQVYRALTILAGHPYHCGH
jgi:23S rRNA (pseudouridine1915-N3)-methyltransferase